MKLNLISKIALLVGAGILTSTLGTIYFISNQQKKNSVDSAVQSAKATIEQFKMVRSYYTDSVVSKLKNSNVKVDFDHKGKDGVIPLPATMIHDLSSALNSNGNGIKLNLYSSFPFPNRKDRVLDATSKEALAAIQADPDKMFVKVLTENEIVKVRVGLADKMRESCVACHNSHPQSPKRDWKVGDVRGVLEVEVPISAQLKAGQDMVWNVAYISLLGATLLIAIIVFMLWSQTIKPIKATIEELLVTASNTESVSTQVSSASDTVATNSSQQAAAVHETTEAFEHLIQSVEHKTAAATQASELSEFSQQTAHKGSEEITKLVESIADVSKSSQKIQEISTLIDDISFQTNLLALNAAVEAARAGDQGKGFSVVAEAVRNLAQKSAAEAKNIADIVKDNTTKSNRSLEIAKQSGQILIDIVQRTTSAAALTKEILEASKTESMTLKNLNQSIHQISQAAQSNAASSEETTAAMSSLTADIKNLRAITSQIEELLGSQESSQTPATPRDNKRNKKAA